MVRWPLQPLQPFQKTQLQAPFGPSVGSLCHPWFTTTNLSYRFLIFETSPTALCGTTGNVPSKTFEVHHKISFGGIPNSRTDLFLQIFLKRAAKPSAGNNSACSKASQAFSGTFPGTVLNLTWLCTKASRNLLRNFLWNLPRNLVEPNLALHQSLPHLLQNLLRNPVEPDLALHQSLPDNLRGTFSGTLLPLTRRLH